MTTAPTLPLGIERKRPVEPPHARRTQRQLLHRPGGLADLNRVAHAELVFEQDQEAREEILDKALSAQADGDAQHSRAGKYRGDVDAEMPSKKVIRPMNRMTVCATPRNVAERVCNRRREAGACLFTAPRSNRWNTVLINAEANRIRKTVTTMTIIGLTRLMFEFDNHLTKLSRACSQNFAHASKPRAGYRQYVDQKSDIENPDQRAQRVAGPI